MSKEEILKIQTCVLKVNIHCDGCKHKVKKILQKMDGVYTTNIDSEQGKVTVSGNVDPATLIKKLTKSGKYAELWGVPKANQNQKNQVKNMQIDINGKGGNNNKGQIKGGNNQQPKGGQAGQNMPQQLQQMKGFHGLKLPQFKDLKMPFKKDQNQKSVKFKLPEDGNLSDDEYDDYDDDDDYDEFDDDELDIDEIDDAPHHALNKMKPPSAGNGSRGIQMPNMMMNGMMGGQHPQFINAQAKGGNGGNIGGIGGGNAKKGGGGGGNIPVQVNGMGGNNGGKKGGGGGGGAAKNGGGLPSDVKNVNHGGNGGGAAAANGNLGKKGGGMNDGIHGMPHMNNVLYNNRGVNPGVNVAQTSNMPMGQMNQLNNIPMGQMSHVPAVQGLPAMAMNAAGVGGGGGGGGGGYFQGAGPEVMAGNPYYQQLQHQQQQQQLAAMMMNQQRANGNERFQPMMYARPPPAINYVPPYHPYQYPPPSDSYTNYFNDENTSSCNVM